MTTAMFEQLAQEMSASPWTYLLIYAIAAVDAFFPVVPGETMVITGGVLAATGDLLLPAVIAAGALGAFSGDNVSYWLGRWFGERAADRLMRGRRARKALAWARGVLDRQGMLIIAMARFVPGGRTAVTLTAGITRYPYRRFAPAAVTGALLWGSYSALVGYVGGSAFQEEPWKALLLGLGIAAAVTTLIEAGRMIAARLRARPGSAPPAEAGAPAADPGAPAVAAVAAPPSAVLPADDVPADEVPTDIPADVPVDGLPAGAAPLGDAPPDGAPPDGAPIPTRAGAPRCPDRGGRSAGRRQTGPGT